MLAIANRSHPRRSAKCRLAAIDSVAFVATRHVLNRHIPAVGCRRSHFEALCSFELFYDTAIVNDGHRDGIGDSDGQKPPYAIKVEHPAGIVGVATLRGLNTPCEHWFTASGDPDQACQASGGRCRWNTLPLPLEKSAENTHKQAGFDRSGDIHRRD